MVHFLIKYLASWLSWLERRPVTAEVAGSSPAGVVLSGIIAQLGEHLPYKQGVTGSSPVGPISQDKLFKLAMLCMRNVTATSSQRCTELFELAQRQLVSRLCEYAGVAELADAQDLKSCRSNTVPVRFRSPALNVKFINVSVAQLDRALGYGPRCREFESSHSRLKTS